MTKRELFGSVSYDSAAKVASRLRGVLERRAADAGALPGGDPFLVLFSGLPGTGKSHFARSLVARVPMMVLESDHLRKTLVAEPEYTPDEHAMVFSAAHLLIEEYLRQGWRVLFEATNLTDNFRQPVYKIAERTASPITVVRFTAPPGVVRKRLEARIARQDPQDNSDAGWTVYCKMRPYEQPIPRAHITIDSSAPTNWALEQIVRQITLSTTRPGWPMSVTRTNG